MTTCPLDEQALMVDLEGQGASYESGEQKFQVLSSFKSLGSVESLRSFKVLRV